MLGNIETFLTLPPHIAQFLYDTFPQKSSTEWFLETHLSQKRSIQALGQLIRLLFDAARKTISIL